MARHVRKGDNVAVTAGKHRGATGKVLEVLVGKMRVRVAGVGVVKKHLKPGKDPKLPEGGIVEKLASIHWSNISHLDPVSKKPTKIGYKRLEDGRKVRVSKASGESIENG